MNARTDQHALSVPEIYYATLPSGVRMPYVTRGAGEPLLFVHGSLCDYRYWNGQMAVLSRRFQCVSVSLSHYWPADDLALSIDAGSPDTLTVQGQGVRALATLSGGG